MRCNTHPPRVGLRVGRRLFPAIPVTIRGDRISLLFRDVPRAEGEVRVLLEWADGAVTEIDAVVTLIEDDLSMMRLDISGIAGEWEPFLAYLGEDSDRVGEGAAA